MSLARRISIMGFMTALVCVLTMTFQLYIYETHGYFNFGEIGVYISALLFGPIVGGVAGGLGSALADIFTGYFWYAPGTLVIKGLEGFIVGLLNCLFRRFRFKRDFKSLVLFSSITILIFLSFMYMGLMYYSGPSEIYFGIPNFGYSSLIFSLPNIFWIFSSVFVFILFIYVYVRIDVRYFASALSCIIGGLTMILGYFLYEFYVLSYGWAALIEVPFNFMQMLIGLIVSSIVYVGIEKRGVFIGG
ncbi:MAG: ECF transporter S component [Candidatus Methanomethylicia archaeon]